MPVLADQMLRQISDPVEATLLIRAFMLAIASFAGMIYLEFHVARPIPRSVHYGLGLFSTIFIVLGAGVLGYPFPAPGAILSAGFTVIGVLLGIGIGATLADPDVLLADPEPESPTEENQ